MDESLRREQQLIVSVETLENQLATQRLLCNALSATREQDAVRIKELEGRLDA